MDTEYIENADVLTTMQNIFGDGLVVKAEIEKDARYFDPQTDNIRFDACHIRITLFNGHVIGIWNSEWGIIALEAKVMLFQR